MFPVNLYNTSGLSILLHGVMSRPGATLYDKQRVILNKKGDKDQESIQSSTTPDLIAHTKVTKTQ